MKRLTKDEFIKRFQAKYGNKYTFEKSVYVNSKIKMVVTCPVHGDFAIRPVDLINGYGCPSCGGTKQSNTEEFIRKATYVHNGFFTYEKCKYINSGSKVTVTCPIHGDFDVKANNHLNGCNCPQCSREGLKHPVFILPKKNASTKKSNTDEFIRKAVEKYGSKYSYDKVIYRKSNLKVIITCPTHGDFEVTPNHFLSGRGCPLCAKNKKKTTVDFINELQVVQPFSDYDYSKVVYKNIHTPVTLICRKCNFEFQNVPANLLKYKQGCPKCHESHLEKEVYEILAKNGIQFEQYKRFDWLGRQSLDFYIPVQNIAIECQGIQHFQPVEQFGGVDAFRLQIKNDFKKQELCEKHNVRILYFAEKNYDGFNDILTSPQLLLEEINR